MEQEKNVLLTEEQFIERLKKIGVTVSKRTLQSWRSYNKGPDYVLMCGVKYPRHKVEQWEINEGLVPGK